MTNEEYTKLALKTASGDRAVILERIKTGNMLDIQHAAYGIATEAGEIVDQVKKHVQYGRKFDRNNIIEESGDALWYLVVLLQAVGSSLDEAMKKNIEKLTTRYGESFSEEKAINRDVEAERKVLESN